MSRVGVGVGTWLIAAVLAVAAAAQVPRPPIGDGSAQEPGHGWLVVPGEEGEGAWLVHLPPRSGVTRPAEAGTVRRVRDLKTLPAGVAAVGDRVYLLFERASGRSVLSGRAVETVAGMWAFEPAELLDAHPAPPNGGELRGFVGTAQGPAMLSVDESGGRLVRLRGSAWEDLPLPEGVRGLRRLTRWGADPAVVDGGGRIWALGSGGWAEVGRIQPPPAGGDAVMGVGGQVVVVRAEREGGRAIEAVDAAGLVDLGRLDSPVSGVLLAPLGGASGRIVALGREPGEGGRGGAYRLREVSAATGQVLHDGEPVQVAPVSAGEFRLLVLGLVMMMATVVLIAVRPAGEGVGLATGMALAEPGRRFAATVVDLGVALLVVSSLMGVRMLDVLTLTVLLEPGGWSAVPGTLVAGGVIGAVSEGVFGRTVGKLLMGCRVVASGGGRAGMWRSVVRNGVKWLLPPVAALAVLEPAAPHRGDALAGLAVVVDLEEEAGGA